MLAVSTAFPWKVMLELQPGTAGLAQIAGTSPEGHVVNVFPEMVPDGF